MVPHSLLVEIIFLPYYPKELILFPHLRENHSTPSLLNNPDTDFYQDIHCNSPPKEGPNLIPITPSLNTTPTQTPELELPPKLYKMLLLLNKPKNPKLFLLPPLNFYSILLISLQLTLHLLPLAVSLILDTFHYGGFALITNSQLVAMNI